MAVKFEFILEDGAAEDMVTILTGEKFKMLELSFSEVSEEHAKWYKSREKYLDGMIKTICAGSSRAQ